MSKFQQPGIFSLLNYFNWNRKGISNHSLKKFLHRSDEPHISKEELSFQELSKGKQHDIKLSKEQKVIRSLIIKTNKNVFYTGAAGTGKSVLLHSIIKGLKAKYKNSVSVTATTGIAAVNIGGQTLHSFAGLTPQTQHYEIKDIIKDLPKGAEDRWRCLKALVIDEVSMLNADLFEKLNCLAQYYHNNTLPFGGIQLVLAGDFFQLPPIEKDNDKVKYCFEADSWSKTLNHTIVLAKVHRQREEEFINMLNEFRYGYVSKKSNQIMSNLEKAPNYDNDGILVTELYAINKYVNNINTAKLAELPYQEMVYEAKDWEHEKRGRLQTLLKNCLAPKRLILKRDAQVMLLRNVTQDLVNGTKGVVIGWFSVNNWEFYDDIPDVLTEDESLLPVVKFINGQTKIVPPFEWKLETKFKEKVEKVASRLQIPLMLCWAISIHKSQGHTLERVKVNLDRTFENGQTYVALSRATSLNSLQVLNFSADKVFAESKVIDFYKSLTSSVNV
ncbi:pif1 helicase Pfh1 [Rhizophagus clarus]|uniref:ATP-dependent DNA helicase n=1 Tax=Rhizophagus clarus TaxID=94130 RepID=A0A8H3QTV7_9GLOM|nr:pif1 helicase Pfh1 [Rhizophagus clarus]